MKTNLREALEGQNRLEHIFKIAQAVAKPGSYGYFLSQNRRLRPLGNCSHLMILNLFSRPRRRPSRTSGSWCERPPKKTRTTASEFRTQKRSSKSCPRRSPRKWVFSRSLALFLPNLNLLILIRPRQHSLASTFLLLSQHPLKDALF